MSELVPFQLKMNNLKFNLIFFLLFFISLIINLTFSQLSWAKNVFEVSNVQVDVTAEAAAEARKKALIDGKTRAFQILLKRLTLRVEHKILPKLTAEEIFHESVISYIASNSIKLPLFMISKKVLKFVSKV